MDKYKGEDLTELSEIKWQMLTTSLNTNKPIDKIWAMADLILNCNPDILLLTEVGGKESLENLNRYFLKKRYNIIHFNSNSGRGIDISALIKPNIHFTSCFHNHNSFARGVLEINTKFGGNNLCILHTHLKSKLNLKGEDFEGRSQRKKEVLSLGKIISNKEKCKNTNHHIMVTGDLNGIIYQEQTEPELAIFANNFGMHDVFEHLNRPFFDRWSYLYYNKHNEGIFMQLDYCLMKKNLAAYLNAETKILDFNGDTRTNFPATVKEKFQYPSDHYPLQIVLNTKI